MHQRQPKKSALTEYKLLQNYSYDINSTKQSLAQVITRCLAPSIGHTYLRALISMIFSGRSGKPLFSSPALTSTAFSALRPKS